MELKALSTQREAGPPASENAPQAPVSIPDHELVRCIGRGSYGEVWLGRNMMGRYRAIKIVHRRAFRDARPFERELSGIRKFEPVSRSHEGFVDVLHVGINEAEGYFYYVMELGDDPDAGQAIDPAHYTPKTVARELAVRGKISLTECVQIGLSLSAALGELHHQGLVHRDIKPSNIVFVQGVAKLADIGLVAGVEEARSYVGTEGFIPPEGPGTPRADIYSLGKVLYEMSTGKDRQDFPDLPTALEEVDAGFLELNEVILRACNSDPTKRYQTAQELRADLLSLANGESVRRLRVLERRWSHFKRLGGLSLLVLVLGGFIGFQASREWRLHMEVRQQQVGANVAYGTRAVEAGDMAGALPYFTEALRLDQGHPARELEDRLRFGSTQAQCPKLVQMWFTNQQLHNVSFSPDGSQALIVGWRDWARVFDVATGQAAGPAFGQAGRLWGGSFSPAGTLVALASEDKTAQVWRFQDGTRVLTLRHPEEVLCVGYSPDGRRLVTGCGDGKVRLWSAASGQLELVLPGHTEGVYWAVFSPDGRRVATASRDGSVRLWDGTDGHSLVPPLRHPTWVNSVDFSPDGALLVSGCCDHKAYLWDAQTGQPLPPALEHGDLLEAVKFSPDGRWILTACLDHTARLWDASTHQPLNPNPILRHSDRLNDAVFSPRGRRILTCCLDGTVRLWDLAGSLVQPLPRPGGFSADRNRLVRRKEGQVRLLDSASGQELGQPWAIGPEWSHLELNEDGRFLILSGPWAEKTNSLGCRVQVRDSRNGQPQGPELLISNGLQVFLLNQSGTCLLAYGQRTASTWEVKTGRPLAQNVLHNDLIEGATFDGAGQTVATWAGNQVRVWQAATGQARFGPLEQPVPIKDVEFNPDGTRLVSCGADGWFTKCYAQVWDAASGQPVGPPLAHGDGVLHAAFSGDGRRILTASEDFTASIWDVATGRQLIPELRHQNQVSTAVFSPDGKWVLTASWDKSARVWNAETGEPLTPPLRHKHELREGRFLSNGLQVVTLDWDHAIRFWDLPVDQRPVHDLGRLARLLSGNMVRPASLASPREGESVQSLWQDLRAKYPSNFQVTPVEIAAWHEGQSEMAEAHEQWAAAMYHIRRLQELQPEQSELLRARLSWDGDRLKESAALGPKRSE